MSTDTLAIGSLNNFPGLSAGQESPSEQIYVLSSSQLQEIISQAVTKAQEPLLDRLEATEARLQDLAARIDALDDVTDDVTPGGGEETTWPQPQDESLPGGQEEQISLSQVVQDLQARNAALRSELEALQEATARERAYDRQRLAKLEHKEPQPLQKDRGEILRALIAANGGKMLAKEGRQKMRMDKATFSRLLDTLKDCIDIKPFHQDKRRLVLIIK